MLVSTTLAAINASLMMRQHSSGAMSNTRAACFVLVVANCTITCHVLSIYFQKTDLLHLSESNHACCGCRLQSVARPGSLLLSLQLDCALQCEQLGARGEVDRLAGQALANSSSIVEQQGLHEMLVSLHVCR
jgi:hypothetical protein